MEGNIQNCWLFDNCNHKDCNKSFCLRKYKLDNLYDLALLSKSQKNRLALKIDSDGTDLEAFKRLAEIDKNISLKFSDGEVDSKVSNKRLS